LERVAELAADVDELRQSIFAAARVFAKFLEAVESEAGASRHGKS
jgi:hypothetical protein